MGIYIKLTDYKNSELKEKEFFNAMNRYVIKKQTVFERIPSFPLAYWVNEEIRNLFLQNKITEHFQAITGLQTGDKTKYFRHWFEVCKLLIDQGNKSKKWYKVNTGGEYCKWYGNNLQIINWENSGKEIKAFKGSVIRNEKSYFCLGVTWNRRSNEGIGFRIVKEGFIYDQAGDAIICKSEIEQQYLSAYLNTNLFNRLAHIVAPINLTAGDMYHLPFISSNNSKEIINLSEECIRISKAYWDHKEVSLDFKQNDLIIHKSKDGSIKTALDNCVNYWESQFFKLHSNEVEINKNFTEVYKLQDEITPDIPLKSITILKEEIYERNEVLKQINIDHSAFIKQFISYSVGCMVGRYSLDFEGLVYAGGDFDPSKYKTFKADKDGIIPILPDDRFDDDITSRFREFVKAVFGEKNYSSNIEYIATILGRKEDETAIECIRRYFLNDFYRDHVKMYKKRPIYWLYSSGKEKGFNAIVYMHRYKKETTSILRMDYLHKLQRSYDTDYETAEKQEKSTSDSKQKIQLQKRMIYLKTVLQELKKYDELLRHYADKQVEIDLDDGVVVNYEKFKDLLVKI